jgi:hypothetical protein
VYVVPATVPVTKPELALGAPGGTMNPDPLSVNEFKSSNTPVGCPMVTLSVSLPNGVDMLITRPERSSSTTLPATSAAAHPVVGVAAHDEFPSIRILNLPELMV